MLKPFGFLPALALGLGLSLAPSSPAARLRAAIEARQAQFLRQFRDLLAIPNLDADTPDLERNAAALASLYAAQGVAVRLLRVPGAPPVVWGELNQPGARRTVTFYAHYDGQPVHPQDWSTDPFRPVVRDGRIWARSAGDDKAAVFGFAAALAALRDLGVAPKVNLHFFLEGEEEAGSPHLGQELQAYAALLRTDAWVLCDGPVHASGRMQIFFGARGVTEASLTVYGPNRPLHDGHYGNWAPNPIVELTHLLDSLRGPDARILIPGFYDDVRPLGAAERAAIAAMPPHDATLARVLGLGRTEAAPAPLAAQIALPALNIRGISGGYVGAGAANAIPTRADASLDFRLVPDQSPERVHAEVERFLAARGWWIVRSDPDPAARLGHPRIVKIVWGPGYPAAQTPLDAPLSRQVAAILDDALGQKVVRLPIMGGSVPMYLFQGSAHTPVIGVPIANFDDNQHAADENLRLDYLWRGILIYASLFARLDPR